jgi:hypothetical protein
MAEISSTLGQDSPAALLIVITPGRGEVGYEPSQSINMAVGAEAENSGFFAFLMLF